MICKYCGNSIPDDSEYCQVCGKKLVSSKNEEDIVFVSEDYIVLSDIIVNEIIPDVPMIIERIVLSKDKTSEECFLQCIFRNLSDKIIAALMVEVLCYDIWGELIGKEDSVQYLDLSVEKNHSFGASKRIHLSLATTRLVNLIPKRVRYDNGEIVDCCREKEQIPCEESLSQYFDGDQFVDMYQILTTNQATIVPVEVGSAWRCSCGEINSNNDEACCNCGVLRTNAFALLDSSFLLREYNSFMQEQVKLEEIKRIETERIEFEKNEKERLEQDKIAKAEFAQRIIQQAKRQQELSLSIQKRREASVLANKKKTRIKVIIAIVIAILLALGGFDAYLKSEYRGQLRNMATEEMNPNFTNVYIDVVSVEPMYFVYQYREKNGRMIGSETLWDVVCKCKTVEGKDIWVSIFYQNYPGGEYSRYESDYKKLTYSSSSPLRLTGRIKRPGQVAKELETKIGDVYVLDVQTVSQ